MISSNLIAFLLIWGPHPPGGWGWVEWVEWGLGMMWEPSRQCGDDGDDVGMTGTTGTTCGDHRLWRPHGDLLGAMGTT